MNTQAHADAAVRGPGESVRTATLTGTTSPLFIEPVDPGIANDLHAAVEWVGEHRRWLDDVLLTRGAYVLRNFPVVDTTAFDSIMESYESAVMDYSGGATVRGTVQGRIYEATRLPPDLSLTLHQEMSYLPQWPGRLAFYCHVAAATGGETIIGDMRAAGAAMPAEFFKAIDQRGVLYCRNFRDQGDTRHPILDTIHRTWQDVFLTDDKAIAEAGCVRMGLEYCWNDDGSLSTEFRTAGVIGHPATGERVWFNQIPAQTMRTKIERRFGPAIAPLIDEYYPPGRTRPTETWFGDGGAIDTADIDAVYDALDAVTVAFPWQAGDVMVLDNVLTAHGRNPYTGDRDVQVALLA
jgi:alpha-ketoglutarate-dependent taurine dioxygenase